MPNQAGKPAVYTIKMKLNQPNLIWARFPALFTGCMFSLAWSHLQRAVCVCMISQS